MNTRRASIAAMAVVLMATAACADGGYGLNPRPYGDGRPEIRPQASGPRQDPDARWRERYSKTYSYSDDIYYQECREAPDPAGVLAGALIGGLLGNAIAKGGGRTGGTIAGVVVGGALGAAMTRNMNCEDRSYAYRAYSDGFNSGRPRSRYDWHNPRSGHHGEFHMGDYYRDPDGFYCATFTQIIYIDGRPEEAQGRACRQPDGSWAVVN